MKKMTLLNSIKSYAAALFLITGLSSTAFAQDTASGSASEDTANFSGTLQMLGVAEYLKDDYRSDTRLYLFQKQARLGLDGTQGGIDYAFLLQFGGEESPKNQAGNVNNAVLSLLDAYIDIPIVSSDLFGIRIGQFKVPFSREQLANEDYLQYADKSINTLGFNLGRDVGFALHSKIGNVEGAAGIFTGGGIDIPQRYLPQELNIPMTVVRLGYNTLDKNIFSVKEFDPKKKGSGVAVYVSGMYEEDSLIGHSSVINSKQNDVSLFYNPKWNPFLSQKNAEGFLETGKLMQGEADAAFQADTGRLIITGGVEANYGKYENTFGKLSMYGGAAQVGFYIAPVQLALRYAVLYPSKEFGYYDSATTTTYELGQIDKKIQEINPALNIFVNDHLSISMDLQIWLDVPVATEGGLGAYNLMTMPGQASVAKGATNDIDRQNAGTARMKVQYIF
ncbi:MAG TPA: porin [Spirochaetota bacterium]|nr:porin [Spirochaetota bacterium]HPS87434.1 porin [Spirochaetota bacterium]